MGKKVCYVHKKRKIKCMLKKKLIKYEIGTSATVTSFCPLHAFKSLKRIFDESEILFFVRKTLKRNVFPF